MTRACLVLALALLAVLPGCYHFDDIWPWNWHISDKILPGKERRERSATPSPLGRKPARERRQRERGPQAAERPDASPDAVAARRPSTLDGPLLASDATLPPHRLAPPH